MTTKSKMSSGSRSSKRFIGAKLPQDRDSSVRAQINWVANQSFLFRGRLPEGGLERIVRAVDANDKRKRTYSDHLDSNQRDQLLLDLVAAHYQFDLLTELDDTQSTREKMESIKSVAEIARSLKDKLLLSDGAGEQCYSHAARVIAARFIPQHGFKALLAGLNEVIDCAENSADLGRRSPRGLTKTFVSEILPKVYERCFERNAGFTRHHTGGPYVRFAVAVMKEMGREISPGTVIAAIREFRRGRGTSFRKR